MLQIELPGELVIIDGITVLYNYVVAEIVALIELIHSVIIAIKLNYTFTII